MHDECHILCLKVRAMDSGFSKDGFGFLGGVGYRVQGLGFAWVRCLEFGLPSRHYYGYYGYGLYLDQKNT